MKTETRHILTKLVEVLHFLKHRTNGLLLSSFYGNSRLAVNVKHFSIYKNDFLLNVMQSDVISVSLKMITHIVYNYHANFSQIISVLSQFLCRNSNLA